MAPAAMVAMINLQPMRKIHHHRQQNRAAVAVAAAAAMEMNRQKKVQQ